MLRTIHLYGELADTYGTSIRLDVNSVGEAVRALECNFHGFYRKIRDGRFGIVRGEDIDSGEQLKETQLDMNLSNKDLHIVPVVQGSKSSKGIISIVLGIVLIAAAVFFAPVGALGGLGTGGLFGASSGIGLGALGSISSASLALSGGLMVLGGISSLLTPQSSSNTNNLASKPNTFLFTQPLNRSEQGGALPLILGRWGNCGTTLVSAGIHVDQLSSKEASWHDIIIEVDDYAHIHCNKLTYENGAINKAANKKAYTVKWQPEPGWLIDNVWIDNVSKGVIYTKTWPSVTGDHTIDITTKADPKYTGA
jgi:predicted phage tail protein